jgi:hydrogenase maturation protease
VSILVACIGNIFQGDDAFGCEVAAVLARRNIAPGVKIVDYGIRSLDLIYALMENPSLTILVDAVSRGEAPGTIYTIEPEVDGEPLVDAAMPADAATFVNGSGRAEQPMLDGHSMDPVQVLRMAKSLGADLGRILLVGCEPADLGGYDGRMGLTEPVTAAIEAAADIVETLVTKKLQEA